MKKKFFAAILMAMALAAFSLAACDDSYVTPLTPVADIPDAATVEVGGLFDFETAAVAKGDKVYFPKSVTITFGENENVEFTGTSFSPAKVGVYTITYTFDIDGETKSYTTAVTARDTTKPSILLSSAIPVRVEYNARLTLPTFTATDICDGSLTADVKVYENNADKTTIDVTEGEFTVNTYDGVVIEATATDAAGNTAIDQYTIAVRGEREVDYFENEPYALANAVGFGGGKTEFNVDPEYVIQGEGSLKFYTDINGKWVFCGFPSIGEAVRLAGGKDAFKTEYSAITLLLYNASPYDCEIEMQYWKKNPQNGLAQDAKLIQKNQLTANCWTKISVPTDKIAKDYADDMFYGLFFNGGNHEANNAYANFCVYADCIRLSKSSDVASVDLTLADIMKKTTGSEDVTLTQLSALGGIDLAKLAVSAQDKNGVAVTVEKTDTAFVLKNASEGRYTVEYMYANGENIDVFSQTVTLYAPLADPYFDGFEGGGYTHAGKLIDGAASVEISTEQAHGGTHSLKITTGEWSRYTIIPLMLDDDMWQKIKDASNNVELSVWLYIENNNTNITKFNVRLHGLAKNATSGEYECGTLTLGGYGNKNNVPTEQWLQVKFNATDNDTITQIKANGGIVLDLEIGVADDQKTVGFTYYVDDLEVTEPDDQVTMTFEDKTAKFASGMTVELADFSDSAKFTGINTDKLTITCNGKAFDYTIEGDKLKFTPAAAGIYEFAYTHKDGHKVKTATQTVTVYTPLADPYFDGFEGGGYTHAGKLIGGAASVEISTEKAHGGTHSLKITTGEWSRYTFIPLMLDDDMWQKIKDASNNVELSVWLYIENNNTNITKFNVRFCGLKNENGNYANGDWAMIYNDTFGNNAPTGQWLQIKYGINYNEGKALAQLKQSGGIAMQVEIAEIADDQKTVGFTYYVDDLEVTDVDTAVTIMAEDKSVPFAGGTSIEIASFTGSNFNADCLTVTLNGQPYTDYTLNEGRLSFAPTAAGKYVFAYTHKNGHMVNTATQTVTVFDPTFDGFEDADLRASVEIRNNPGGAEYAYSDGEGNKRSGNMGLWCYSNAIYMSFRLTLTQEMRNCIQDGSSVSLWLRVKDFTSNSSCVLRAQAINGTDSESWDGNIGAGADVNGQTLTDTEWHKVTFTGEAVTQIKTYGVIWIWMNTEAQGHPIQFVIDDIQVTHAQAK